MTEGKELYFEFRGYSGSPKSWEGTSVCGVFLSWLSSLGSAHPHYCQIVPGLGVTGEGMTLS